nr:RNA polymerase sigma-70 factor [uncultured Parabacteroides sp.]
MSRQYLQDDFLAETIVSDVFFHLWETRKTLDIQISLNAYLIRMVRNFSLNYLQKNYVEKEVSLNGIDITSPLLFLSDEYPLGRLLEKEMTEKVHEEINRLPKETRQVFILSRLEELKHEEIANRLGISVNTVKYHIKQALSILRDRLKDYQLVLLACLMKLF